MKRNSRSAFKLSGSLDDLVEFRNKRGRNVGVRAVKTAKAKGIPVINNGAGTMPVDAPAPYDGKRYSLLVDKPSARPMYWVAAHEGRRDEATGKLHFSDLPSADDGSPLEFFPLHTPAECIRMGIFGGCYFNSRGGKPGIFGRDVDISVEEFPTEWFNDVPESHYLSRRYNKPTNKFGVKAGQDQAFWEGKGWIHAQDPRGWFQWYCRFFLGRRSADDVRQIKRWAACTGVKGRWRNQLCGKISKAGASFDDAAISPVIRQTLLHWAYSLTSEDYDLWSSR